MLIWTVRPPADSRRASLGERANPSIANPDGIDQREPLSNIPITAGNLRRLFVKRLERNAPGIATGVGPHRWRLIHWGELLAERRRGPGRGYTAAYPAPPGGKQILEPMDQELLRVRTVHTPPLGVDETRIRETLQCAMNPCRVESERLTD
jgi:hypothetical protein